MLVFSIDNGDRGSMRLIISSKEKTLILCEAGSNEQLLRNSISPYGSTRNKWIVSGGANELREVGLCSWALQADVQERWFRAVHEAGHAVIGFVFGRSIADIHICLDDEKSGQCRFSGTQIENENSEEEVLIDLAGEAAESLITGIPHWRSGSDDSRKARDRLDYQYLDYRTHAIAVSRGTHDALLAKVARRLSRLRGRVLQLVRYNKHPIRKLAGALALNGRLSGAEATRMISENMFMRMDLRSEKPDLVATTHHLLGGGLK